MKVEWFVENLIDEEKDGLKNVLKLLMNGWQFVKKEIKIVMEILWIMNEWENEYEWRDMDGISEPRIYEKKKNEWRMGKNFRAKIGVWQEGSTKTKWKVHLRCLKSSYWENCK